MSSSSSRDEQMLSQPVIEKTPDHQRASRGRAQVERAGSAQLNKMHVENGRFWRRWRRGRCCFSCRRGAEKDSFI